MMTMDMSQDTPVELLTKAQYASRLGVTERTVQRWLGSNRLRGAVQDAQGRWLIPADAVPSEDAPEGRLVPATQSAAEVAVPAVFPVDSLPAFLTVDEAAMVLSAGGGEVRISAYSIRKHRDYFGLLPIGPNGSLVMPRHRVKEILG